MNREKYRAWKLKEYLNKEKAEGYDVHPDGDYLRCSPIKPDNPIFRKKKYKSKDKKRFINFKYDFKYNREPDKIFRWLFLGLKYASEKGGMDYEGVLFLLHLEGLGYFRMSDVEYYPFSKRPFHKTRIKKMIDNGIIEKTYHDTQKGSGIYYKLTKKGYEITHKVYEVVSEEQILNPSPISTPKIFVNKKDGGKWREAFLKYNENMGEEFDFF